MDELMRLPTVSRFHFIECGANTGMEWGNVAVPTVQYTPRHAVVQRVHRRAAEDAARPVRRRLQEARRYVLGRRRRRLVDDAHDPDGAWSNAARCCVAYGQNGEMLRPENGYPLRLVVPGVQGVSWVKYLRRIEVGDQPWATKDEAVHYIDLMPDGQHRQYTSIQECKSVVTTPSGGQVLLDKGFYNISGLAWSGRGKVEAGGRRRSTAAATGAAARLEAPVLEQVPDALQSRLGVGRQAGDGAKPRDATTPATCSPATAAARGARHTLDLPQQRDPVVAGAGKRRGEECPALVSRCAAPGGAGWRCRAARRRAAHSAASPASAAPPRPAKSLPGTSTCGPTSRACPRARAASRKGQDLWEAKCASCHGVFGESNEVFTPIVGGTTKDDIKTGHVARLLDPAYPGRTTLMKVATVSTLWDYINRAMPWNAPKSLKPDEVYAVTAYLLNLGDMRAGRLHAQRRATSREVQQRCPTATA